MTDWLKQEKFPYVLTLLIALIGWGLTHIVDRLVNTPIIEYTLSTAQKDDTLQLTYNIQNITRGINFNDVDILLRTDLGENRFIEGRYYINPPMKIDETVDRFSFDSTYFEARIRQFQPNFNFSIVIKKLGAQSTPLRITASSPVNLTRASWETFLLKNEFIILFALIGIWVVMAIFYLVRVKIQQQ